MPEPERLGLADVDAVDSGRRRRLHLLEQRLLVAQQKLGFELIRLVEMILDRPLVAPGDEDHVGDAGGGSILHRILNQRLVDDRQHFLRARLRHREEPGAEPGYRKNGLRDPLHVVASCSFETIARTCASSMIATPSACALTSLPPASAPATM